METCDSVLEMPNGDTLLCARAKGHDDNPEDLDTLTEHKKVLHRNGLAAWGGLPGF